MVRNWSDSTTRSSRSAAYRSTIATRAGASAWARSGRSPSTVASTSTEVNNRSDNLVDSAVVTASSSTNGPTVSMYVSVSSAVSLIQVAATLSAAKMHPRVTHSGTTMRRHRAGRAGFDRGAGAATSAAASAATAGAVTGGASAPS